MHTEHKDEFVLAVLIKCDVCCICVLSVTVALTVPCSAFWCAAEWSRKALNEARPWWRRGSSSWKWVSERDGEERSLRRQQQIMSFSRSLTCSEYCDSSHTVFGWTLGEPGCVWRLFLVHRSGAKVIIVIFKRPSLCFCPHRSSEFWCDQIVNLQDRLQTPVRAEEMQS